MTKQRKASLVVFAVLSLWGVSCYSVMAEVDTLLCDRTTDVCTLIYRRARSARVQEFPLHGLTGAELRLSRSARERNFSATVVLLTEDGPIPFMTYSSGFGKSEMRRQVTEVERFLATPSMQRLQLRLDNRVSSSLWAAFPLSFGAAMFLLVYLMRRGQKKHAEGLRQVCEALGFELEEGPIQNLGARFGRFSCFSRKEGVHEGRGLMTGLLAGHPVTVMDHSYPMHSETLAVFPEGASGLPDFELSTSGAVSEKIFATLGEPDINFPENEAFSTSYELRGTDQAGIRCAFAARTLAFFAENHGWSVQTLGGAAIVFRSDKVCAPAEVPRFLAEALTVLGAFPVNG